MPKRKGTYATGGRQKRRRVTRKRHYGRKRFTGTRFKRTKTYARKRVFARKRKRAAMGIVKRGSNGIPRGAGYIRQTGPRSLNLFPSSLVVQTRPKAGMFKLHTGREASSNAGSVVNSILNETLGTISTDWVGDVTGILGTEEAFATIGTCQTMVPDNPWLNGPDELKEALLQSRNSESLMRHYRIALSVGCTVKMTVQNPYNEVAYWYYAKSTRKSHTVINNYNFEPFPGASRRKANRVWRSNDKFFTAQGSSLDGTTTATHNADMVAAFNQQCLPGASYKFEKVVLRPHERRTITVHWSLPSWFNVRKMIKEEFTPNSHEAPRIDFYAYRNSAQLNEIDRPDCRLSSDPTAEVIRGPTIDCWIVPAVCDSLFEVDEEDREKLDTESKMVNTATNQESNLRTYCVETETSYKLLFTRRATRNVFPDINAQGNVYDTRGDFEVDNEALIDFDS